MLDDSERFEYDASVERYRVRERIGAGGMGEVRLGEDKVLGRLVALKFLPESRRYDESARKRLRQEARSAAAIDHPYICKIYEVGEWEGRDFIAMEYVRGETLADRLARDGSLTPSEAMGLGLEVAEALEVAHQRGILHRDLKPSNLMLTEHGHVKVMDFGLAKHFADEAPASEAPTRSAAADSLTGTGARVGTPAYMSPEQIRGESLDARSDFFSLGIVLYEMLVGAHPFKRSSVQTTSTAILEDEAPLDVEALVGNARVVVGKLLAKDRDSRYRTAFEIRSDLARLRDEAAGFSWIPADVEDRTPFVARNKEREEIGKLLERARGGSGALVLIGGEPGVGKTRLAETVVDAARRTGSAAFVGRSYEKGATPFVPFIEIVEGLARALPPRAFRDLLGASAPEIAKVVPELRRSLPDIPPSVELPPDLQQRYLFGSFLEFFSRLSGTTPLVLVLDDVHWADAASLALLSQLASRVPDLRVLVLGTYRDEEIVEGSPFAVALAELVRQRQARLFPLRRLSPAEAASLIEKILGEPPPEALSELVFRETNGNAFFVEELVRHLSEEGKLLDEKGRLRQDIVIGELEVPEGVRLVIGRRLGRLSERAKSVLVAASVVGQRFSLNVLGDVAELDEDALIEAVEEAERARLVRSAQDTYSFEHALVRHTLEGTLSLPRRQKLHRRIADSLERTHGEERAAQIAHHLKNGGGSVDRRRLLRFLLAAAEDANASTAFDEARSLLEEAAPLLEKDEVETRARWLLHRGFALRALGRWHESVADWNEALPIFERIGDRAALLRMGRDMGLVMSWFFRWPEVIELVDRLLRVVGDEHGLLPFYKAMGLAALGRYQDGLDLIRAVAENARARNDESLLGSAFLHKQIVHTFYGEQKLHAEASEEALKRLRETTNVWDYAPCLGIAQLAWLALGRLDEVKALYDEMLPVASRAGHFGALFFGERAMAYREMMLTGDLEAFAKFQEERDLVNALLVHPPGAIESHKSIGMAAFLQGDWEKAGKHFEDAERCEPVPVYGGTGFGAKFLLKAYRGDDDALSHYDRVKACLPVSGTPNSFASWRFLQWAVDGLSILGQHDRVHALYPLAVEFFATGSAIGTWGESLLEKTAGIAAAAGKDWTKAQEHFERALDQAHRIPFRTEQAEVRRWYGRMLQAKGDTEAARRMLERARAEYRGLGMTRHEALARME